MTSNESSVSATCLQRMWELGIAPRPHLLSVSVSRQELDHFELASDAGSKPDYQFVTRYTASTSRHGIGQVNGSNGTPLGLHQIKEKVGAGMPEGTVFKGRQPIGMVNEGHPQAPIAHRILWLDGLEDGLNRGGDVDSFNRYIYIHGVGDESTLGKPASIGCVHLAAKDLIPLFDLLHEGTLVWIEE